MSDGSKDFDINIRTSADTEGAERAKDALSGLSQEARDSADASNEAGKGGERMGGSFRDAGRNLRGSMLLMRSFKLLMEGDFVGAVRGASLAMRGLSFAASAGGIGVAVIAATALAGVITKLRSNSDAAAESLKAANETTKPLTGGLREITTAADAAAKAEKSFSDQLKTSDEAIDAHIRQLEHEKENLDHLRDAQKGAALAQIELDKARGKITDEQAENRKFGVERAFASDSQKRTEMLLAQKWLADVDKQNAGDQIVADAGREAATKQGAVTRLETEDQRMRRGKYQNEQRLKELQTEHGNLDIYQPEGAKRAQEIQMEMRRIQSQNETFDTLLGDGKHKDSPQAKRREDSYAKAKEAATKATEDYNKIEEENRKKHNALEEEKWQLEQDTKFGRQIAAVKATEGTLKGQAQVVSAQKQPITPEQAAGAANEQVSAATRGLRFGSDTVEAATLQNIRSAQEALNKTPGPANMEAMASAMHSFAQTAYAKFTKGDTRFDKMADDIRRLEGQIKNR